MANEYDIDSIDPIEGSGGTDITASVSGGIPGQKPNSLQPLGGMFVGSERNFSSAYAVILDNETYTEFSIVVPDDIDPGNYHIQIFLATKEKVGPRITLNYPGFFKATKEVLTMLRSISPSSVSVERFLTQTFTIRGSGMLEIDETKGFSFMPPAGVLRISELEDTMAQARIRSGIPPTKGSYQLRAQQKNGGFAQSQVRLTIT